jgi:hypothetical protein
MFGIFAGIRLPVQTRERRAPSSRCSDKLAVGADPNLLDELRDMPFGPCGRPASERRRWLRLTSSARLGYEPRWLPGS